MKKWLIKTGVLVLISWGAFPAPLLAEERKELFPLIQQGRATSLLVLPDEAPEGLVSAAHDFVGIIKRATGANLPIIREAEDSSAPPDVVRIYLGKTKAAGERGLLQEVLAEEEYRMLFREKHLFIIGDEAPRESSSVPVSQPVRWALNRILEEQLGVRWLWPGDLGTYVPVRGDISVPGADLRYQPKLQIRKLRMRPLGRKPEKRTEALVKMEREAVTWVENHQGGRRGKIGFGHAFEHWWAKYGEDRPDYFAETPPGVKHPFLGATNVKLRLSNPDVIETIAREYKEAGAPQYWSVCPNDRYGFDLSAETRAWDIPSDLPKAAIWGGEANLTPRYVMFWNRVYDRLKEINPEVTLTTYAYYSYFKPPPQERPLKAKCVIGYVSDYHAYDTWRGWAASGNDMVLRPNWWHLGADAPFIPNRQIGDFIRFAWENGMVGIDMDSIVGWWGTQGANYYLVARLMTRPDLSNEAILTEYAEAFGPAKAVILQYLSMFEALSEEYDYPSDKGALARLLRGGKLENRWAKGSHEALPYLWGETVLHSAFALLRKAEEEIGDTDELALKRVHFLRDGLEHLRMKRDLMQLSASAKSASKLPAFRKARLELIRAREQWCKDHVVWGPALNEYEDGYRIFVEPLNASAERLPEEM